MSDSQSVVLDTKNREGRENRRRGIRRIVNSASNNQQVNHLSSEVGRNIDRLVDEEIRKNGYRRENDPFVRDMYKLMRKYGMRL
ncbi:hypothetical protein NSA56_09195 [Oceanobacillus caeni]|uniref:Sporulation protein n=1 Tax=Oceanobacillus caeni TaxID=405946 RepID=A0ABR5MH57_9BACI|nr:MULTISPECIES: hypothetical protein [Bacillaceae]KKE77881.1 hypothetical protein WH51_15675 [Bacilli bacterium VT-13-104]PZD85595.1 hypothetical protein DEJ64_09630 [Bacilli bacterium]KPH72654.1 hypothetical protein AFL42_13155 [Oceanobacillus caeni]MBU8791736.1 hypothetical protein [Oceanobacillus caeni]MCR1834573.1 hypothetical protein [Oceanobacillus caeni]